MINVNDRTAYWIGIDIANTFGNDKMSFDERINWVNENYNNLEKIATKAESPWEFRNAVTALRKHDKGERVNHMVYLDASNQALQLYAVLTGDKKTGSTCNLANGKEMADAYKMLSTRMNEILGITYLTRNHCKKALMTTMYGKQDGTDEIINKLSEEIECGSDTMKSIADFFGWRIGEIDKKDRIVELYNAFKEALIDIAPKAISTMESLTQINKDLVKDTYKWTLPDGFKVKFDVKVEETIEFPDTFYTKKGFEIKLNDMNIMKYAKNAESRAMSPNVIHSVDGYVAREMIRRMERKFITTIHDAFACHPSNCDLMVNNYKDILCEILNSSLLNDIVKELSGYPTQVNKTNTLTCEDIRNSMYLLA